MENIMKVLNSIEGPYLETTHYALIRISGHEFDIEILESDTAIGDGGSNEYITKVKLLAVDGQEPTQEVVQKFEELVEKTLTVYVGGDNYADKY